MNEVIIRFPFHKKTIKKIGSLEIDFDGSRGRISIMNDQEKVSYVTFNPGPYVNLEKEINEIFNYRWNKEKIRSKKNNS